MIIEGGTGNGYSVGVSNEFRLLGDCIQDSREHHVNHSEGLAFSILFGATPTGAGDCFFYIKNTSSTDIVIEGMSIKLAADEYIDVKHSDTGTPVGGNDVVPGNLNAGSGNIADGTFQNGDDITGLSGGVTVYRLYHISSTGSKYYNFEQDLIIPPNKTFALYCGTGTTAIAGHIDFNYHNSQKV